MLSKLFSQIFLSLILIVAITLSILNTDKVIFDYAFGQISLPLIILLIVFFILGLVLGGFITKFIYISKKAFSSKKNKKN